MQMEEELIYELEGLDLSDVSKIIPFMYKSFDVLESRYRLKYALLSALKKAGYTAGENTGDDAPPASKESVARWMIGQFMQMMAMGLGIHQVFLHNAASWSEEYGVPLPARAGV